MARASARSFRGSQFAGSTVLLYPWLIFNLNLLIYTQTAMLRRFWKDLVALTSITKMNKKIVSEMTRRHKIWDLSFGKWADKFLNLYGKIFFIFEDVWIRKHLGCVTFFSIYFFSHRTRVLLCEKFSTVWYRPK
jgi:hypothetical protein